MGNFIKQAARAAPILALVVLLLLSVRPVGARVGGTCSNCHTMHNSQNGLTMKLDSTPSVGAGGGECFDCHAELRPEILRYD